MSGVVLYGPPTAGKDTITSALSAADPRFRLVTKLKQGSGRSAGYRFVTSEELSGLRDQGRIVVETRRYGNVYAVDRRDIAELRSQGLIPVVHIGNVADLRRLLGGAAADWLRVLLWVPADVCEERSRLRGDADTTKRLTAWAETAADLLGADVDGLFDVIVRTDRLSVDAAVEAIGRALHAAPRACTPDELRSVLDLHPTAEAKGN
ncbi:nucleoside/nucleotide kinase family protein [Peterkaempfera bronchialis]|uniref:Guanylate kinase n=1 Tax=Peterkaempfera bronchialis TaxID=2126346 RepID=A0A345SSX2_9ACTN|nr:guanylate kinase [Peterkaempfera bronchialis]AXI76827.1 guanylate kinase [Peterkaempfera bronchialis]